MAAPVDASKKHAVRCAPSQAAGLAMAVVLAAHDAQNTGGGRAGPSVAGRALHVAGALLLVQLVARAASKRRLSPVLAVRTAGVESSTRFPKLSLDCTGSSPTRTALSGRFR